MFSYGRCAFPWNNNATWLRLSYLLLEFSDYIFGSCIFFLHSKGPKFDQPSYPGFERDVFKSVSDYFHSLPQPLLTFQYYELFVNVLGMYEIYLRNFDHIVSHISSCFFLYCPKSRLQYYSLVNRIGGNVGFYWKWFC